MKKLSSVSEYYRANMDDVLLWCDSIYQSEFAEYFDSERTLYSKLKSKQKLITDGELEDILTTLPLQLFSVSEHLSNLRIKYEVVKLGIKEKVAFAEKSSSASTATARKEEANTSVIEDQLLSLAYATLIDRVEKEISFSRELIMSAKKIWDARRRTDTVNPVSEGTLATPSDELPRYVPGAYIK